MFWLIVLLLVAIAGIASLYYSVKKIRQLIFSEFTETDEIKASKLHTFIAAIITIAIFVAFCVIMGYMNGIVILIHFVIFSLFLDCIRIIIIGFSDKHIKSRWFSVVAIVITGLYLGYAYYNCHNIVKTSYSYSTYKTQESLKMLVFSDSHMGTTIDPERFEALVDEINEQNPDVVLIVGDFVDDSTTRDELFKTSKSLGNLNTKYGVYFSYGNHDKGYYESSSRGWDYNDLENCLTEAGVKILKDEVVNITDTYCLVGRLDASEDNERGNGRKSIADLTKDIDKNKYTIVMDHQPADFENEAAAEVDMVLCGHTHGGQLIPINHVGEWIGVNDLRYGKETRNKTNFVVNSGVSCWALDFKTGCISEYLEITIN